MTDGHKELEKDGERLSDTVEEIRGRRRPDRIRYRSYNDIKEVSKSYKEAKLALDVGKIFFEREEVLLRTVHLGIGRLIYQLPIPLCKMFIREIFEGKSPDDFDEETLATINKFFENSLNVSETSRQLYIHRNTLGISVWISCRRARDLIFSVFEDAITFKIALNGSEVHEVYGVDGVLNNLGGKYD